MPGVPLPMGAWVRMCSPNPSLWSSLPTRMIQNCFVDMENMFELFNEEQEVGAIFPGPVVLLWGWAGCEDTSHPP